MSEHPFAPPETLEPPASLNRVLATGGVGVTLTVVAFVVGLVAGAPSRTFDPHWADGPRVILAALGMILAGSAASLRPRDWLSWLPLGAAGLLCYGIGTQPPEDIRWMVLKPIRSWHAAVPNSWDSVQMLGGVTGVIAFVAAGFTRLPIRAVLGLMCALLAFYASGIVASVLSPPSTPFLVEEYWRRFSRYHCQFLYINNAYHFYSPEPGPPSELWICLKYAPEEGNDAETKVVGYEPDTDWVSFPRRNRDAMDPLRLSYYRRIALSDQSAQVQVGYVPAFPEEQQKANVRRITDLGRIPKSSSVPDNVQYVPPQDQVIRQTLPSFANHFAKRFGKPGRVVSSVRIYRVLHDVLTVERFRTMDAPAVDPVNPGPLKWREEKAVGKPFQLSPYYPALYSPYYMGEYDVKGRLLDPTDPELYWLVPVMDLKTLEPGDKPVTAKDFDRYFLDYVSIHAGSKRPKE